MDEEVDQVASVFKGVAHPTRVAALLRIDDVDSITELADVVGVNRGTMQDHVEMLREQDLVYRPSSESRGYRLTPLGRYVEGLLVRDGSRLVTVLDRLDEVESEVRDEFGAVEELPLDEGEVDRAVQTETWERIWDEVAEDMNPQE